LKLEVEELDVERVSLFIIRGSEEELREFLRTLGVETGYPYWEIGMNEYLIAPKNVCEILSKLASSEKGYEE